MINYKKIIAIIMVAAFSIAGLIACGGAADVTSSVSGGGTTIVDPPNDGGTNDSGSDTEEPNDNNGDNGSAWNVDETKGKTFYSSSYRTIYVPYVGKNWVSVSYNDTDRLTRLWKAMIDRGIRNGRRKMYIKFHDGDIFFDENYNMRWSKQPDVILYEFFGGVIAQYKEGYGNNDQASTEYGYKYSGKLGLGGLYASTMSLYDANEKFHNEHINYLFGYKYSSSGYGYAMAPEHTQWAKETWSGSMSIMMFHPGYPVDLGTGKFKVESWNAGDGWTGTAYAMQWYRERNGGMMGYREKQFRYNIQGNTPEKYFPVMAVHQLYHLGYRWALDKSYDPNNYAATINTDTSDRLNKEWADIRTNPFK